MNRSAIRRLCQVVLLGALMTVQGCSPPELMSSLESPMGGEMTSVGDPEEPGQSEGAPSGNGEAAGGGNLPGSAGVSGGSKSIPVYPVASKQYLGYGNSEYSPSYLDNYQRLRAAVWNEYVAYTGRDWAPEVIGQFGQAEASQNSKGEWSWGIDVQGHVSEFRYSLDSKAGYSGAGILLVVLPGTIWDPPIEQRGFVVQIFTSDREFLFELPVGPSYEPFPPYYEFQTFDLTPQQFAALPIGDNVALFATTSDFKTTNPLPAEPTSDDMAISAMGSIAIADILLTRP